MRLFGSYTVLDDKGKPIGEVDSKKSAVLMARAVLGSVKKGNKVVYSARNPLKLRGGYANQPAAEKALKKMGAKGAGSHVGYDVVKKKWVIVTPTRNAGPASHRKSKKAMKAGRAALARTAGYTKSEAGKIGKRAVYRGDSRKFGPERLAKYRNPRGLEYGVAVIGSVGSALSKAGFPTLAAARKYLGQLRSRGLLLGRAHELLEIDNDAGKSKVIESKQNAGPNSKRKTKKRKQFRASGKPYEYAYTGNFRPGSEPGKKRKAHAKRTAANPSAALQKKISHMKPGAWYPTTLAGKRAKVQRKGSKLVVKTI